MYTRTALVRGFLEKPPHLVSCIFFKLQPKFFRDSSIVDRQIKQRTPLGIMKDTVFALFIRELRTRFGGSRLGYFWAIAEPAGQAALLTAVFSLMGRTSLSGIDIPVFMVVGLVSFKLFTKLISQLSHSVLSNKGLMAYRQVEPIDPVITRLLIELATTAIVFVMLMISMYWFLGYQAAPVSLLGVLVALGLLVAFSIGIALILCVFFEYFPDLSKLVNVIMTPMMIVSGVFYSASMVPTQYWGLLDWNPVFHCLELIRESYYYGYNPGFASLSFVAQVTVFTDFIGLLLFVSYRTKLVSP